MRAFSLVLACVLLLQRWSTANVLLHNPPGSNNRNRERDAGLSTTRLFQSDNSGGGYPWRGDASANGPDPITYYHNSTLRIQWTVANGCGGLNGQQNCVVILQYGCESDSPGLRDGYPTGAVVADTSGVLSSTTGWTLRNFANAGQNQQGNSIIPLGQPATFYTQGTGGGTEFGLHESFDSYTRCSNTNRNTRLFAAGQTLQLPDARSSRGNINGQASRRGLECPEERDFYPYWRPTMWHDIAVLVSDLRWCNYYRTRSENVSPRGLCNCNSACIAASPTARIPMNQADCLAAGGNWAISPDRSEPPPVCQFHPIVRENGYTDGITVDPLTGNFTSQGLNDPDIPSFDWVIPPWIGNQKCVIRIRYNISSSDYNTMGFAETPAAPVPDFSSFSLFPYVSIPGSTVQLSLVASADRIGAVYQDRTHVFQVAPRPPSVDPQATIWNLNVRGRRGALANIYPALPYDFVPKVLRLGVGDFVHIQLHGSDFNPSITPSAGEGMAYSDRYNLVQIANAKATAPFAAPANQMLFNTTQDAVKWALLEQDPATCGVYSFGSGGEANAIDNCGKLNRAPARYPPNPANGLVQLNRVGTFHYMSTRSSNFGGRQQKGVIIVSPRSSSANSAPPLCPTCPSCQGANNNNNGGNPPPSSSDESFLDKGGNAAGITVAIIAGFLILVGVSVFCWRRGRNSAMTTSSSKTEMGTV